MRSCSTGPWWAWRPRPTAAATGWWVPTAGVYALGDARYQGSVSVLPLAGLTVVIDPGHDGGNGADPGYIDRPIDGGGFTEPCDTTGTETDNGYTEHAFNFDVALRAQALLAGRRGRRVVLTRSTDTGVGPCVNVRAAIANDLHADVAVSIHADGGPPGGSGFAVDTPVAGGELHLGQPRHHRALGPAVDRHAQRLRGGHG